MRKEGKSRPADAVVQGIIALEARSRSVKGSSGTKLKSGKAALSLSTGAFQGPPPALIPCTTASRPLKK